MTRSQIVLADPQYGVDRILRPSPDFETLYQGQAVDDNPLYLYPRGVSLDPQAGRPGYDARLIRGLRVPVGARIIFQLPNILYEQDADTERGYIYVFQWRERNLFDYRTQRIPYHLPRTEGPTDSTFTPPSPRVVLPVAFSSRVFVQTEPAGDATEAVEQLRRDDLRVGFDTLPGPIISAGVEGVVQQGIFDPATVAGATRASFLTFEIDRALADELIVAIRRDTGPANWDFTAVTGADRQLSTFLGTGTGAIQPNNGVYVKTGSAP